MKTSSTVPSLRGAATSPRYVSMVGRSWLPLVLAGVFGLALLSSAEAQTPRVEYRVVSAKLNLRPLEQMLNAQAAQGWELVQITDRGMAIFKKKTR